MPNKYTKKQVCIKLSPPTEGAANASDHGVAKRKTKARPKAKSLKTANKQSYAVKNIIDVHYDEKGKRRYKVRWNGYGASRDTWEPERNVSHLKSALNHFRQQFTSENFIHGHAHRLRLALLEQPVALPPCLSPRAPLQNSPASRGGKGRRLPIPNSYTSHQSSKRRKTSKSSAEVVEKTATLKSAYSKSEQGSKNNKAVDMAKPAVNPDQRLPFPGANTLNGMKPVMLPPGAVPLPGAQPNKALPAGLTGGGWYAIVGPGHNLQPLPAGYKFNAVTGVPSFPAGASVGSASPGAVDLVTEQRAHRATQFLQPMTTA